MLVRVLYSVIRCSLFVTKKTVSKCQSRGHLKFGIGLVSHFFSKCLSQDRGGSTPYLTLRHPFSLLVFRSALPHRSFDLQGNMPWDQKVIRDRFADLVSPISISTFLNIVCRFFFLDLRCNFIHPRIDGGKCRTSTSIS